MPARTTRLVMTLLVRNNADLIEHHIRYHRAQGVDYFVVTDNGSNDGTRDILARFAEQGTMHIIDEPEDTFNQSPWVTRMAKYAYDNCEPDWILHSDADEFWIPESGNLKDVFAALPETVGSVLAERKNFLPSKTPSQPFWQQMIYRDVSSLNPSGYPLPGKVAHRPGANIVVGMGNHTLTNAPGELLKVSSPVIFHFPQVTYETFEDKIVLGGAALERNVNLPREAAYTWREKYTLYQNGGLRAWWDSQPKIETHAEKGITDGTMLVDTRLRDFMNALNAAEVKGEARVV